MKAMAAAETGAKKFVSWITNRRRHVKVGGVARTGEALLAVVNKVEQVGVTLGDERHVGDDLECSVRNRCVRFVGVWVIERSEIGKKEEKLEEGRYRGLKKC